MKWIDPKDYNLNYDAVQVLCEVTQPTTSDLPRSCDMPISSGDHGVGDQFVSIGWRDDEGDWHVAGWDMMQDFWCEARCYIVRGWQPLADIWPNQYQATIMTEEATMMERDAARYKWIKRYGR